jgi:CheY-like chemotaxis protein
MARILITDDEAPLRTIMATVLRENGHDVEETSAAREAVERHQANPADLIITDLVMKEMDGTELLRRVQAFAPQTRFIAVSGARQGKIYLNMAKMLGAHRILAKPFAPQELLQAVNEVLAAPAA